MSIDLTKKPFYLTHAQVEWVENTIVAMTEDEKAEQLFCLLAVFYSFTVSVFLYF